MRTVRQVMGSPQPPLPQRPFVVSLTFDDGLRSQYGLKDIFARHDAHGTFYINSGAVDAGEAGTMTWAQIRDLQAAGHDIGGHTRDHVNMLDTDTSLRVQDAADLRRPGAACSRRASTRSASPTRSARWTPPPSRSCAAAATSPARKAGTVTSDGPIFSETIPVTENPYAIRILGTNYNGAGHARGAAVRREPGDPVRRQLAAHAVPPDLLRRHARRTTTCMAGYRPVDDLTIDAFLGWIDEPGRAATSACKTIADVMGGGATAPLVAVTGPADGATVAHRAAAAHRAPRAAPGRCRSGSTRATTRRARRSRRCRPRSAAAHGRVQPGTALPDGTYTVQAGQTAGRRPGPACRSPSPSTRPAPRPTPPLRRSR